MDIIIRPAIVADAVMVSALSAQLGYSATVEQTAERIFAVGNSTNDAAFVAVINDKIAGWIHVFYILRIESASFCEIGGLVTDIQYRNKGIGKALIEQAKGWTTGKGIPVLKVRSNVIRHEAHTFYLKIGFRTIKQQEVFEIEIPKVFE